MNLTSALLSTHRKRIRHLLSLIETFAFKSASMNPLVKGSPVEVYRTCGKHGCACSTDPSKRHGPYRVVQVYRNGKQKQVSLKKSEPHLWKKVGDYQKQMKQSAKLKKCMGELEALVHEIIEARLEEMPK